MSSLDEMTKPRAFYIELRGKFRDDGTMFVKCPKLPFFSAVVAQDDWSAVLAILKASLEMNFGPVSKIDFIDDAESI